MPAAGDPRGRKAEVGAEGISGAPSEPKEAAGLVFPSSVSCSELR